MYQDHHSVTRWQPINELPDESLRCVLLGHEWQPAPLCERPGYGARVLELRLTCPCGRQRLDVVDPRSFALLSRSYPGGCGPAPGAAIDRPAAHAEWAARTRRRSLAAV